MNIPLLSSSAPGFFWIFVGAFVVLVWLFGFMSGRRWGMKRAIRGNSVDEIVKKLSEHCDCDFFFLVPTPKSHEPHRQIPNRNQEL